MPAICTGRYASIGGLDQWIAARGDRASNPGLFIIGGPGVALSRMAPFFSPWERSFTLLHWDQPGAGATAARAPNHGGRQLSLARLVEDAGAAIKFAREEFDIRQFVVLGYSGGSVVGLQLAHQRPDLICAYVGVGQFVNWRQQEARSYDLVLQRARRARDQSAITELEHIGVPPYADVAYEMVKSRYASAMTASEATEFAALDTETAAALRNPPEGACYLPSDYTPQDPHALALAAYIDLRDDFAAFDAASLGSEFGVAMFFLQGADDIYAVSSAVEAYAASIRAPHISYETIEGGGHSALFLRRELGDRLGALVRPLFP